jgi:outer membrane protein assembly factor BamD
LRLMVITLCPFWAYVMGLHDWCDVTTLATHRHESLQIDSEILRVHSLMQPLRFIIALSILISLAACSSKDKKQEIGTEQVVYQNAQRLLTSSSWDSAIETLQLLEENFPFGVYAENAQLELIYAYFRSSDYDLAISAADRFIRLHPQHRNVDYAYYIKGVASFYNESAITTALISDVTMRDSASAKDAFSFLSQLILKYPKSPYALDAQQRMIYLRNTLARYEIHTANYYFKRGAYVAAANRGRFVVENMQGTPAVPDGLAVMAQAYYLLNMQDLADDAAKVLASNYPQHPTINKKGRFDYEYQLKSRKSWMDFLSFGLLDKRPFINFDSREIFNPQYQLKQDEVAAPPAA